MSVHMCTYMSAYMYSIWSISHRFLEKRPIGCVNVQKNFYYKGPAHVIVEAAVWWDPACRPRRADGAEGV